MLLLSLSGSLYAVTIKVPIPERDQTISPSSLSMVTWICMEEKQDGDTMIMVYRY